MAGSLPMRRLFFHTYGITDDATIENIYDLIIADPANYLKYYIGYLEFLKLKKNAVDKWGDNLRRCGFIRRFWMLGRVVLM